MRLWYSKSTTIQIQSQYFQMVGINVKFYGHICSLTIIQLNVRKNSLFSLAYLMTYLLDEFHARLCRASCRVWAISGNNSSSVSLLPEIIIRSPISGEMFTATTSQLSMVSLDFGTGLWLDWDTPLVVFFWPFLWRFPRYDTSSGKMNNNFIFVSFFQDLEARNILPPPRGDQHTGNFLEELVFQFA